MCRCGGVDRAGRKRRSSGDLWAAAAQWDREGDMAVEVRAHITGTVWKILVQVGERVAEEQQVAILESMKMEMPLEAPEEGEVTAIHVTEGQAVEEGDLIVTLG